MIVSALDTYTGVGLAALFGIVLGAVYILGIFRKAFLGECRSEVIADAMDLKKREIFIVFSICLLVLFFGLFPQIILSFMELNTANWVELIPKK